MILAILLHVGLIALLLWNFAFQPEEQPKQFVDSPVKARLVTAPETPKKDATSLKKRQQKQRELEEAKKKLEEKRLEEKKLEEQKLLEQEKLQQEKLEQEKIENEKLAQQKKQELEKKQAEQKKLEQQKKAEAEKKRLAEIERKKVEAEKKKKAEAERKRKEAEKKKKAEAERKKREAAEKKRKELEALEASLDDELFEADKGEVRQTQIMSEVSKIQRAIRAKIIRNWDEPSYAGICVMRINMGPGGIVLNMELLDGELDYCETAEAAVNRSAPLPSSDDPAVMAELKSFKMTFDPSQKGD